MGWLGMGITQGDDYYETYRLFMECYDKGEEIEDITRRILNEQFLQFEESDGVNHDVYFALAKAQWKCGALSDHLLEKVKYIVESGENLNYLAELGADTADLKKRQKALAAFLKSLTVPVDVPRKRHRLSAERALPDMTVGDCFSYRFEDRHRIVIILDIGDTRLFGKMAFCCILKNSYEHIPDSLSDENVGLIGFYTAKAFLPKSKIKKIGHLDLPDDLRSQLFGCNIVPGKKEDFFLDFSGKPCLSFGKLLEARLISP